VTEVIAPAFAAEVFNGADRYSLIHFGIPGVREDAGARPRRGQYSQHTSAQFARFCTAHGVRTSTGRTAICYDALAESVIGLFKTELIKPRGPWQTAGQVEIATLEYAGWFNHRRLYEACGDIPPAELETAHYRQNSSLTEAALP
jgi:putative transposase